ncbi:hypothetical protein DDE05_57910 [Streptomyces cavourensis]|nr:hypothetical protein DDE05_57910 [Streptomyces cavourensis]
MLDRSPGRSPQGPAGTFVFPAYEVCEAPESGQTEVEANMTVLFDLCHRGWCAETVGGPSDDGPQYA